MANYGGGSGGGGYARTTTYGTQGGDDGGGFVGGSQQGSQGGQGGSKYDNDSLRPVTIKQLVDSKEDYPGGDLKIDGLGVTQITLVGQVRAINAQTTNITYRIDDGTGVTDVKKWVDAGAGGDDDESAGGASKGFALDTYVRIFGRLTTFNSKKHVGAHFIRAIDDFNEVNYHLLEAAYVHLALIKGPQAGGDGSATGGGAGDDSMFVDGGYGGGAATTGTGGAGGGSAVPSRVSACSRNAQNFYKFLSESVGGGEGVQLNAIVAGTGLSAREVLTAADELLGTGLIYTTIDDETWAILDY
ncbi:hypothetical protein B0H67DRAFT_538351 [Lasiosphaeris hirsuta]|uniref:Replication protein A C-terminal domain-containing protein n=1 Tax=Lasiosphaeris hirsuta TaxID=260670 RepID=A0AA40AH17_9PEZI|nr:hypothetical protein B0H67DRAFT_538351 [Lasiosphaeris hirsuta]